MATITGLKLRRRRWGQVFEVEVDGTPWAEIEDEVALRFGVKRGLRLDDTGLAGLLAASQRRAAERRTVAWLAGRVRTARQVATYLRRAGFAGELAQEVASWAGERGLVDEQRYAEALGRRRRREGRVGPRRVEAELRAAGVGAAASGKAAEQQGGAEELVARCLRLLERRSAFRAPADPGGARRKARDFLLRRGFPGGVVREALGRHFAAGGPGSGAGEDPDAAWEEGSDELV